MNNSPTSSTSKTSLGCTKPLPTPTARPVNQLPRIQQVSTPLDGLGQRRCDLGLEELVVTSAEHEEYRQGRPVAYRERLRGQRA
jgi:hypothetical protein